MLDLLCFYRSVVMFLLVFVAVGVVALLLAAHGG